MSGTDLSSSAAQRYLHDMNILIVAGSNRRGAKSLLLSKCYLEAYGDCGANAEILDLADLPTSILLPTAYETTPADVQPLIDRFCAADGIHFAVPEYNGSFPGLLKLFIDLLPYPQALQGRPCAFTGIAAGQFKGLRAVEHLQAICGYRNAHQFPQRLFIGESMQQFDENGRLTDPELRARLQAQAEGFLDFCKALKG